MSSKFHPFKDMIESAKAQHEVDKANFEAVKAQSKAQWEEAKLSPKARQALMQQQREEQIASAKAIKAEADARIANARALNEKYKNKASGKDEECVDGERKEKAIAEEEQIVKNNSADEQ